MRLASKLLASCAVLALIAVMTGSAHADPPGGVTPRAGDVVGVGSDTMGYLLDQLSQDYDMTHSTAVPLLYSWDPISPATGKAGGRITTKAACKAIVRPEGSSAGISALEANTADPSASHDHCIDFAGSSSVPAGNDRRCVSGGVCFIQLAGNAVTWASRDAASGGTDAPASLTRAQLKGIYQCKITNWAKVGGRHAQIKAFLPQTSSGTRASWLLALGGGTAPIKPGACVSDEGNTLQDNQGISPVLDSAEAIFPYSVADYLAQAFHDAPCAHASCSGSPACSPATSENMFGCDQHGVLGINEIGGSKPALPWPLPKSACAQCAINPRFSPLFQRTVFLVVRFAATPDHIPGYLEPFFAAKTAKKRGWVCTSPTAQADIRDYGFLTLGSTAALNAPLTASPQCGTPYH